MANIQAEPIDAELGQREAWVGEGVPLYITLKATGPFSGAASFDFPELPGIFFMKQGRPVVGSETIRGDTWMTQRHEFRMYSQQAGQIDIPPIPVRYEAKKDFVSDPEVHERKTGPLTLISKRPPGAEGLVVSVTDMAIRQEWSVDADAELKAGDVVKRRIVRSAPETTGMIFPEPNVTAPDGVQLYPADPVINDKTDRGIVTAGRIDEINYQFLRAGTVRIPDITFSWWNPAEEQLETKILEGRNFVVTAPASTQEQEPFRYVGWLLSAVGFIILLLWVFSRGWKLLNRPERKARRAVIRACGNNDAKAAYASLLRWKPEHFSPPLAAEWARLSTCLFGEASTPEWQGQALCAAFRQELKLQRKARKMMIRRPGLLALNPQ